MAEKKPIDDSLISRVVRGVRHVLTGNAMTDFGPGNPLPPTMPETAGRQFDYPVSVNTRISPRQEELTTFGQMRALADSYDLLRLAIETRKDQVSKMKWAIRPSDDDDEADDRCDEVRDFLRFPDKEHNWQTWLRMIMEDMLVIDAATLYPRMTRGGDLYALEPMDGATIRRVIDATGRTPRPPDPAYQQIIKGIPASDYNRDQLLYLPRNVRTHKLYGYGPVEQIIMTVNIAIRRQVHQLQYYTEGSTPDLIMSVPEAWTVDQIKQFQTFWDSMLAGNTAERRGTKFVPNGVNPINTREKALKDEYDEWLARVICYAFSLSPQALIKEINRATAETSQQAALEEGLTPIMNWIKDIIDLVVWKYFGYTDLEFVWEEEDAVDPLIQAQINDLYVRNGTLSIDEVRGDLGRESIGMPNAVYTGAGVELVGDILDPPEPVVMPTGQPTQPGKPPIPEGKIDDQQKSEELQQPSEKFAKRKKKLY